MTASVHTAGWQSVVRGAAVVLLAASAAGCNVLGAVSGSAPEDRVTVKAEYEELSGHRVAVMVSPSVEVAQLYPNAAADIARLLASHLAGQVEAVTLIDSRQVAAFQSQHPHWQTLSPSELARRLGAERLVLVDLSTFTTRDQENRYLWRGAAEGNVSIYNPADDSPNEAVHYQYVSIRYPHDRPIGLLDGDEQSMRLATVKAFVNAAGSMFHDHRKQ